MTARRADPFARAPVSAYLALDMVADLYPSALLALAADIPHLGPLPEAEGQGRARSAVCGSVVEVALRLDDAGRIADIGIELEACALGQACASVLGRCAIGASWEEVAGARDALAAMLKEGGPPPQGRFAELAALAPARDYPRRHASAQLAFKAAADAMASALAARREAATTS